MKNLFRLALILFLFPIPPVRGWDDRPYAPTAVAPRPELDFFNRPFRPDVSRFTFLPTFTTPAAATDLNNAGQLRHRYRFHCEACGDLSQRTVDLLGNDIQERGDEQLVAELGHCRREKLVEGTCRKKVSRLKMRERFQKSGLG